MSKIKYLVGAISAPMFLSIIGIGNFQVNAASTVEVSCDVSNSVPTITATLSAQDNASPEQYKASQKTDILSFPSKYFSSEEAAINCQKTAESLQGYYSRGEMNYLASDTINGNPVVCAVERRGISCDSYGSEILFSLAQPVNPNQLLYDMLGGNFKDSQIPSSRTVSRIYTDLRPNWWPF